jgi:outer membrane lipoprotein-sorting protein
MPSISPLRAAVIAVLVAVAATGAYVMAVEETAEQPGNRSMLGANASERVAAIDGLNATVETVIVRENRTNRTVRNVSLRPGTRKRRSVLLTGPPDEPDLVVSNGSVTWRYDAETNNVTRLDVANASESVNRRGEYVEQLFARLNRTSFTPDTGGESDRDVSALPVVPYSGTPADVNATNASQFDVVYNGTATVDGRETHVLTVSPDTTDSFGGRDNYTRRVWIDTERYYPLKTHLEYVYAGDRVEVTETYTNVSYDPNLTAETFRFDPPSDANLTERTGPTIYRYGSITQLRSQSSMTVPKPTLPAAFSLETATFVDGDIPGGSTDKSYRRLALRYVNETSRLTVLKYNRSDFDRGGGGERVQIGPIQGTYREFGPVRTVSWSCYGRYYIVSGQAVSKSLLLRTAESVRCE